MQIDYPEALYPIFETDKRYIAIYGGRGSGKSWGVALYLLASGAKKKIRIMCAREYQTSIKDSVHKLLSDMISSYGLDAFYKVTRDSIIGKNGTEFLFVGLRMNINNIKSSEGINIVWVEEAQSVSRESLDVLIPTIRAEGSKIIYTFNPTNQTDPVWVDYAVNDRPDTLRLPMNFSENPFFPDVLRDEMEYDRERDPDKWAHIWNGQPILHSDSQILKGVWRIEEFTAPAGTHFYYGSDYGFAQDPTTAVRCYISEKRLYIDHEAGGKGVDIDKTAEVVYDKIPGAKEGVMFGDSSRPETISYLRQHGYPNVRACYKPEVKDGIAHLRGYEISIHPRCKETAEEFRLYQYEVDRISGQVTNKIKKGNDHYIDAIRYALSDVIKNKKQIRILTESDFNF